MSRRGWIVVACVFALPGVSAAQDRDALQIACGPRMVSAAPAAGPRVAGGPVHGKLLFADGEPVVINAGSGSGLQPGQVYYVRRQIRDRFARVAGERVPDAVHTAGWIRIVDVQPTVSMATVVHACDGVMAGDYLEPFALPAVPQADRAPAAPDFAHPARVVLGDERQQTAAPGMLMVIDRGADQGVRGGQQLTLYRPSLDGRGPSVQVGTGVVLAVDPGSALMRIERASDAVYVGDYAAVRR